ncbi:MAG: nucleotide exchange factor GrpE, partial [Alphaproteobacteria bacterium]|nr:nucleotide exchange factor GrpE [Alphaproteobacteria bacterium]MDX5494993.1 nucleotide exchange factor GrpE [Alphaproteobacteria bacterium]
MMMAKQTTRDPVCGMEVVPGETPHTHVHERETFHFCSAGCARKFAADPAKYLAPEATSACCHGHGDHTPKDHGPVPPGTSFTCPMHPEIVQDGPGACPICGMALEPMGISRDKPENEELKDRALRLAAEMENLRRRTQRDVQDAKSYAIANFAR